jgi:glycosyltransferase involved in cell wall biosynthesis
MSHLPSPESRPLVPLVITVPKWCLSGANTFLEALMRALSERGYRPILLLSRPGEPEMPYPEGVEIQQLPPTEWFEIKKRQRLLAEHLKGLEPCVFLPNYDFDMALAAPALSPKVAMLGILHSDEFVYYDCLKAVAPYWAGVVAVSEHIEAQAARRVPALGKRLQRIAYGIAAPAGQRPRKRSEGEPLKVVYCGRIIQYQKRIQDLARIIEQCRNRKLPVTFTLVGEGGDRPALEAELAQAITDGYVTFTGRLSPDAVFRAFAEHDVIILTSAFEGLPLVLLEAMSAGCIPVVTRIDSGVNELVETGHSGYLLPVGDTDAFVQQLADLSSDHERCHRLSQAAYDRIHGGPYAIESVAEAYHTAIHKAIQFRQDHPTPAGKPILPRDFRLGFRLKRKLFKLLGLKVRQPY